MTLIKGAIINSVKVQPGGWWEGTLASTGKTGMFPDNFVRVLDADDKSPVVLRYVISLYTRCQSNLIFIPILQRQIRNEESSIQSRLQLHTEQ